VSLARSATGRVKLVAQGGEAEAEALFDTGATKSFISLKLAEKLGYTAYDQPKAVLLAVRDKRAEIIGELVARVIVLGYELPLSHVFGVVKALSHDVIIGSGHNRAI